MYKKFSTNPPLSSQSSKLVLKKKKNLKESRKEKRGEENQIRENQLHETLRYTLLSLSLHEQGCISIIGGTGNEHYYANTPLYFGCTVDKCD